MVVRPRREGRRLSDLPDVGGFAGEARAVRGGRRSHLPYRLYPQGQDAAVQRRRRRALYHQFRTRQEERDGGRSLGAGLAEDQRGRWRRLQDRKLEAGKRDRAGALRRLEERTAAEDQARDRARRPLGRHAPRDAGAGRCGYFQRLCAARFRADHSGGQGQGIGGADPECALVHRTQHGEAAVRQCEATAGHRLGDAL
ncbi:hypothetical protein ABIA94_003908 [Bradyrhizobium sp. LA7.1]